MPVESTNRVPLNTSLPPVAHAVLGVLAAREDPGRGAANVVLVRLLREELERVSPGAWGELVAALDEASAPQRRIGTFGAGVDVLPPARALSRRLAVVLSERLARAGRGT